MTNLFAKRFCGTFIWNFGSLNHSVEPFSRPFEPFCGTWKLVRVEPVCGTLGNLNF